VFATPRHSSKGKGNVLGDRRNTGKEKKSGGNLNRTREISNREPHDEAGEGAPKAEGPALGGS